MAGNLVFKPLQDDSTSEAELRWQAATFDELRCDDFQVARVRRAVDGALVVDGWCASARLEGQHEEGRWEDVIAVGERFHAALAGVARPAFIAARTDRWAIGDRVAWGELPIANFLELEHLARLAVARQPLNAVSQVVHGDLTGNVLFADPLPPAVIDLAPYWRPVEFATAVVVADAMVWECAGEELLGAVAHIERFGQYLVRALIYRIVVDRLFRPDQARPDDADPFAAAVELACRSALSA